MDSFAAVLGGVGGHVVHAVGADLRLPHADHQKILRAAAVKLVFADGGDAGKRAAWAQDKTRIAIEVVRRPPFTTGFVVPRRRWVVERPFAWILKCRRLVRDDEQLTNAAETELTSADAATVIRRWPSHFSNTF